MKVVKVVKVNGVSYVAIPAEIARGLDLKRGDQLLAFLYNNENIVFKKVDKQLKELITLADKEYEP